MGVSAHTGMGANPYSSTGVSFRVWAPFAGQVWVATSDTKWVAMANPLTSEGNGFWSTDLAGAKVGTQYKFVISNPVMQGGNLLWRMDPYAARIVTDKNGSLNAVVCAATLGYKKDGFEMPSWNELVIYELNIWSFGAGKGFEGAIARLPYLKNLGINAIELMPIGQFLGLQSVGYNPAYIFAVEDEFGGPDGCRNFVNAAHAQGIAVLIDVVYNHLGNSAGDMWQFDGWSQGPGPTDGGVYFYNDWRAVTSWADTRFDYGRGEVRQYLRDNALSWTEDRFADGLRFDSVGSIRNVQDQNDDPSADLADGWSLLQWINSEVAGSQPWKITIAEDLKDNTSITLPSAGGGAGFGAQWGAFFLNTVRDAVIRPDDAGRDMNVVAAAIGQKYNGAAFQRVIYTESHDVAAGGAQVPSAVSPSDPSSWWAKKRSTLGAAIVMTAPGIPMIFMGQEILYSGVFDFSAAMDWSNETAFPGILALYRDLVLLRRNATGLSAGPAGQGVNVFHVDNSAKLIGFHRYQNGGPGDDVVVVLNFGDVTYPSYTMGFPRSGMWEVRFNSDSSLYDPAFGNAPGYGTEANGPAMDGLAQSANVAIGPYSALVYSQGG